MNEEIKMRAKETHRALIKYYADMGKRYANLEVGAQTWTTDSASGSCAFAFIYLEVDCQLSFPGGPTLIFNGEGGNEWLGSYRFVRWTGSL